MCTAARKAVTLITNYLNMQVERCSTPIGKKQMHNTPQLFRHQGLSFLDFKVLTLLGLLGSLRFKFIRVKVLRVRAFKKLHNAVVTFLWQSHLMT